MTAKKDPPRLGLEGLDSIPLRTEYARALQELTLADLNREIGQPTGGSMSRLVRGEVPNPRADLLTRMASALGCDVVWLQHGVGNPPPARGPGGGDPAAWAIARLLAVGCYEDAPLDAIAEETIKVAPRQSYGWWLAVLITRSRPNCAGAAMEAAAAKAAEGRARKLDATWKKKQAAKKAETLRKKLRLVKKQPPV